MSQEWQLVIVGICVAAAVGWVAREIWRFLRPKSTSDGSCGSCGSCSSPSTTRAGDDISPPLVTLQLKELDPTSPPPSGNYVPKSR